MQIFLFCSHSTIITVDWLIKVNIHSNQVSQSRPKSHSQTDREIAELNVSLDTE